MQGHLENQIAIVTGASRGIGRVISLALADSGAHVILVARTATTLQDVEDEIISGGGKVTAIPTDLSKEQDILALFRTVAQKFGKPDILAVSLIPFGASDG